MKNECENLSLEAKGGISLKKIHFGTNLHTLLTNCDKQFCLWKLHYGGSHL